jgi:hypothetical protein
LISSCSLTKGLKENEYVVYQAKIEGIEKSDQDALTRLIKQTPNTRIPLLNTSIGVVIYNFGLLSFDSTKILNIRKSLIEERDSLIIKQNQQGELAKKEVKRYNKINSKLTSLRNNSKYKSNKE